MLKIHFLLICNIRVCRELNGVLYCDIINLNNLSYFGISEGKTYEISIRKQYDLGDKIYFKPKDVYVKN